MMNGSISFFIKSIILTFLTLFIFVNILFAFDLVGEVGVPVAGGVEIEDFSEYYFGFNTFFNSWQIYFDNNDIIQFFQDSLKNMRDLLGKLSINNLFQIPSKISLIPIDVPEDALVTIDESSLNWWEHFWLIDFKNFYNENFNGIISALGRIFDVIVNIPYMIITFLYFGLYLIYIISLVIQFLLYIVALLSGQFNSKLTYTYGSYITVLNSFI